MTQRNTLMGMGMGDNRTRRLARRPSGARRTTLGHAPPALLQAASRALVPRPEVLDMAEALAVYEESQREECLGPIISDGLVSDGRIDPSLSVLVNPHGKVAEAYRALFYHLSATAEPRRIMVSASDESEESAVCAANLALAIGHCSDERVLLVEARFAKPRAAQLFGYTPSECFGERLARHRRHIEEPWRIAHLMDTNLSIVAVDPSRHAAPALDALALREVTLHFMRNGFSYIVIDGPPAVDGSDARYAGYGVDGVLLVAHSKQTRTRNVRRAMALLDGTPVLGCALVDV